jgi:hypothetical protein
MITRLVVLLFAISVTTCAAQPAQSSPKRIPVSFAVESEGPQGLWTQSSEDLSTIQLQSLEQLVKAEIMKQEDVALVEAKDPKDHLHVAVVAGQLPHSGASSWVIASSVVTIADSKGNDLLVTHDVIAGPEVRSVARSIGAQLATVKLRFLTGIMK